MPDSESASPSPILIGSLAALAATMIWSGNFIIARGVGNSIPPATLAFCRWSVACLALLPFGWRSLAREWTVLKKNAKYLLATALLGVTVFNTLIYVAGHSTAALNLSLISTFIPAFILLLSRIFLGEPLTPARLGGLLIAVSGVVVLLTKGQPQLVLDLELNRGDLWMLFASLLFAGYTILVRKKPAEIGATALLTASFVAGLTMLTPWMIIEQLSGAPTAFPTEVIGSILYIGLGASLAAYWCWTKALTTIGPARAGVIYYSLPLFCGIEAALILGEPVTWVHFVAGALIIGGIWLATRK